MNCSVCKSRGLWVGLAVVAILAVLVAFVYPASETPLNPVLPNPNGYDDLVKAGEAIQGSPGDYPTLDPAALRDLVSSNAEPLRLLRVGLTRQCYMAVNADMTNGGIPQLTLMKRAVQLLAAEGRLHELGHQPAEAARSYMDAIRFGNEVSRGGFLITRLVGIACEAIGYGPLARLVPQLAPEHARSLAAELEKINAGREPWSAVMANERRYHRLLKITPANHPLLFVMGWWQSRAAITRAEIKHKTAVAHEQLLVTELALRGYLAGEGHAPARLDDLTNGYLTWLPQDPFRAQPLVYRPQGTNWVLYSVGADGVDDGGQRVGKGVSAKGDLFYDSP